uniref:Uncharacterized protein n=1 Tax=Romanomermis culicivorax TaxID=13658 RepID=A0A915L6S8_ROMCU
MSCSSTYLTTPSGTGTTKEAGSSRGSELFDGPTNVTRARSCRMTEAWEEAWVLQMKCVCDHTTFLPFWFNGSPDTATIVEETSD